MIIKYFSFGYPNSWMVLMFILHSGIKIGNFHVVIWDKWINAQDRDKTCLGIRADFEHVEGNMLKNPALNIYGFRHDLLQSKTPAPGCRILGLVCRIFGGGHMVWDLLEHLSLKHRVETRFNTFGILTVLSNLLGATEWDA